MDKLFFVFFVTISTFKLLTGALQDSAEVLEKNQKPRWSDSPRDGANRTIYVILLQSLFFSRYLTFFMCKMTF